MPSRRPLRLVAGALVLALPLLTSCGFGKATDKVYTPAVGTNDRDGDVDVLAAVIVAAQPSSGTFLASLANNDSVEAAELTGVAGAGEWTDLTFSDIDPPIEVAPRGFVNMVNEPAITVTGDFGAGDFTTLTLTFASGDTVTLDVPVVYACDAYAGLDTSVDGGLSADGDQTEDSESPDTEPTDGSSPSETAEAAPRDDLYDCVAQE